ncbi:hypothetical protein BH09BAC1_BH09BAC1_08480 [soil metagenome]
MGQTKSSNDFFAQPINCVYLQPIDCANGYPIMRRDVFQAIADPTRRAIILLIALHAMTPNALAEHFHTSRQAVSKHLQILVECELVKPEQQGREIYYQLNGTKMAEIDHWLEQFKKIWESRFNQLDDVLLNLKNNPQ